MGVKEFYDEISEKYDSLRYGKYYSHRVGQLELAFIQNYLNKGTCLEVGAGTGRVTGFLLEHMTKVVAADISEPMLEGLKAKSSPFKNLRTEILDVYDLDGIAEYGTFECAISLRLLPHLEDPLRALKKISGAVVRNGTVIIDFWNIWGYQAVLKRLGVKKSRVYTRYFTLRQMQMVIRQAGLDVVDRKGFGFPRLNILLPLEKSSIHVLDTMAQRIIWICRTQNPMQ